MANKYLVAIDSMGTAQRMAEFLKRLLAKDDAVTIYSVLLNPVMMYGTAGIAGVPAYSLNNDMYANIENARKEEIMNIAQTVRKILSAVLKNENVTEKLDLQKNSVAHQIAEEAQEGGYDVIVMGKHNAPMITDFLLGSVTHKVMHLSKNIPVLTV